MYGVRVGLRVNRPEALERVIACLPWGWKPAQKSTVDLLYSIIVAGTPGTANIRQFNLAYRGALRLTRTLDVTALFATVEADLQLQIAENARRRLFVHAGVVGWEGQAIVIPGRSLSGKSTLVAALVEAGAIYYSDEYAVFDARGNVHPFARPITLRAQEALPPRTVTAEELGGQAGVRPLPVGLVVCTRYRPGGQFRPRVRTAGQGLLALLANTVPARRRPRFALATLRQVLSQARVLQGTRGETEQAVAVLLGS
jgi:hypothetical protein